MHFCPERLIQVRESLHINKAEAARRLNLSAMLMAATNEGNANLLISTLFILHTLSIVILTFFTGSLMRWKQILSLSPALIQKKSTLL